MRHAVNPASQMRCGDILQLGLGTGVKLCGTEGVSKFADPARLHVNDKNFLLRHGQKEPENLRIGNPSDRRSWTLRGDHEAKGEIIC